MLTQEQGFIPVNSLNLTVYEVVVITQMIEKLLRSGLVTGTELNYVANIRYKLRTSVMQAIGYDIDNPIGNEDKTEIEDE